MLDKKIEYYAYFDENERGGITADTPEQAIKELKEEIAAEQESIKAQYIPNCPIEKYRDYDKSILSIDLDNKQVNVVAWKEVEALDLVRFISMDDMLEDLDDSLMSLDWEDSDGDYVLCNIELSTEQKQQVKDLELFIAKRILEIYQPGIDVPLSHKIYKLNGEFIKDLKDN